MAVRITKSGLQSYVSPVEEITSKGSSSGGGSSGKGSSDQALANYQSELARQAQAEAARKAAEEAAKQKAIEKQRADAAARAAELAQEREAAQRFSSLSKAEQRKVLQESAQARRASNYAELQAQGRTLTPQAQALIKSQNVSVAGGTYNKTTQTFTNSEGQKQSVSPAAIQQMQIQSQAGQQAPLDLNVNQIISGNQSQQAQPTTRQGFFSKVRNFFESEQVGENVLGIGVPFTPAFISFKDIKENIPGVSERIGNFTGIYANNYLPFKITSNEKAKSFAGNAARFEGGVVAALIPTTVKQTAIIGGSIAAIEILPATTPFIYSYFGYGGAKAALNPSLTPEERVAGGLVAGASIFGLTSRVASGIKLRDLNIPTETGEANVKLLGLETSKGRAIAFGAKTPEGFNFGTPDVSGYFENLRYGTEIKVGSALETRTILKGIENLNKQGLVTERANELIPVGREILRETIGTKSKFINPKLLTTATERLPEAGVAEILNIAKEREGVLFGSKSRAFQLADLYNIEGESFKLNKVPRDVELRFDKYGEQQLQEVTTESIERLRKLGTIKEGGKVFELGTAREIKDKPFTVEAKVDNIYEKVAEFKGKEAVVEGEKVPEYVAGIQKVGKPLKIKEISATKLNEELRGVMQGVLRIRKLKQEGDIYYHGTPQINVNKILKEGLKSGEMELLNKKGGLIFFTKDYATAKNYGESVIGINLKESQISRLKEDAVIKEAFFIDEDIIPKEQIVEINKKGLVDVYPSPKRLKDIGSVYVSAKTLEMSKLFPNRLSINIQKFESLFPQNLVREQVTKILNEPGKDIIADFRNFETEGLKITEISAVSPNIPSPSPKVSYPSLPSVSPVGSPSPSFSDYSSYSSLSPGGRSKSPISPSPGSQSPKSLSPSPSPSISQSPSPSPSPAPKSPSLSPYPGYKPKTPSQSPSPSLSPYPKIPTNKPPKNPFKRRLEPQPAPQKPKYIAQVRRGGVFEAVGGASTIFKALNIGALNAQSGLGQSVRVVSSTGQPVDLGLGSLEKQGFYGKREKKSGVVFIEKSKSKINTPSEKQLLFKARAIKLPRLPKMKGGVRI